MAIYSVSLLFIFFYALAQLNLLLNYLKYRNKEDDTADESQHAVTDRFRPAHDTAF